MLIAVVAAMLASPPRTYDGPQSADEPAVAAPTAGPAPPPRPKPAKTEPKAGNRRKVLVPSRRAPQESDPDRAASVVTRRELEERLPRSAPDALRGEPGVYVQQSAHGQASPFVRGLTGQQTVMFFDDVRLNNSTFRQGPNQYFFTVDSRTIQRLEVLRGSASTRYGSDAIGGALLSTPIEPSLDRGRKPVVVHGAALARTATADAEVGGRGQLDLSILGKWGLIGGVGYRDVGQLRSGGRIIAPGTGQPQNVPPVFEPDGKTQRGTGFRELTADTRAVYRHNRKARFTLGYYDYRQYDAPRTDKCPPPTAPQDECLTYDEQFRTLIYGAFEGRHGPAGARDTRLTLSYQRQHEDRELIRGAPSVTELTGVDNVHAFGTRLRVRTKDFEPVPWFSAAVRYGADAYYDRISSTAAIRFSDVDVESELSRGQYLDGAQYVASGAWAEAETTFVEAIRIRGGGRFALAHAHAAGDDASESAPVDRTWVTGVGNAGIAAQAVPWLRFVFNVDQGFRAPNLDDLTSRQQTGPGFQFENTDLKPERSVSLEGGMKVEHHVVEFEAFVFQTMIRDFIQRAPRSVDQCPAGDPGCGASQTRFQLVNLDGRAVIRGADGGLRLHLPHDLGLRATIAYAWGEGPNPVAGVSADAADRLPLSRIPPLNGTAEFGWRSSKFGVYTIAALRWALKQDRLALQDEADPRIPIGGTPGFAVVDLRAGYRMQPHILFSLVFENVADTAYRYHGSSVNGPGRGLIVEARFGF